MDFIKCYQHNIKAVNLYKITQDQSKVVLLLTHFSWHYEYYSSLHLIFISTNHHIFCEKKLLAHVSLLVYEAQIGFLWITQAQVKPG